MAASTAANTVPESRFFSADNWLMAMTNSFFMH